MPESVPITAAMLYDLVHCPHRVTMDFYGDPAERDEVSPFVQLLWERGSLYEKEVIENLDIPFLDLSTYVGDEKNHLTLEAMRQGEPLIYAGRIEADDLLGEPDLLRKESHGYVPGDIKSGAGTEGSEEDRKPKKHYGVQLALYADILEQLSLAAGRRGFIWDVHGEEANYDLTAPKGPRTPSSLWDDYQDALVATQGIITGKDSTLPAYGAICKQCHWYSTCLTRMQKAEDLTLIPGLGRANRDNLQEHVGSISDFAQTSPESLTDGKKSIIPGLGADRLRLFHERAKLLRDNGEPYLRNAVDLPDLDPELFFDIEYDPMREICYLHGFVERRHGDNDTERFVYFFAEAPTPEAEERAFAEAIAYMQAAQPCAIYYYSPYERTKYRKLRERYPHVLTEEGLEHLFESSRSVGLYNDIVRKATEWPTRDHSIKTLAKYLGFEWRDADPSGAASIEWFHRWVETGDPDIRQRILDYNEDDCRATRILLDGIRTLAR